MDILPTLLKYTKQQWNLIGNRRLAYSPGSRHQNSKSSEYKPYWFCVKRVLCCLVGGLTPLRSSGKFWQDHRENIVKHSLEQNRLVAFSKEAFTLISVVFMFECPNTAWAYSSPNLSRTSVPPACLNWFADVLPRCSGFTIRKAPATFTSMSDNTWEWLTGAKDWLRWTLIWGD